MSRDEHGPPLVRIRVKERVDRDDRTPTRAGNPEKVILLVVGACLGLGLGYLLAGKLASILRPPLVAVRAEMPRQGPESGRRATPAAPALEFDLPAEGE